VPCESENELMIGAGRQTGSENDAEHASLFFYDSGSGLSRGLRGRIEFFKERRMREEEEGGG